jgi:hypothetical protein
MKFPTLFPARKPDSVPRFHAPPSPTTNFILLGHPRCGSNLIVSALADHPRIAMRNEILSPEETTRQIAWPEAERTHAYRPEEDGATFLNQRVFSPKPQGPRHAFGFKMFYEHARTTPAMRSTWPYLATHDIRVIHLIRRNLLDALISLEVAQRSTHWHRSAADPTPPPLQPFHLDPLATWNYFDRITHWRTSADLIFANHRVLTLDYDSDLCAAFQPTLNRIFAFLDCPAIPVTQHTVRQRLLPPPEQITNYAALQQAFAQSPYGHLFP